jgi:hypothetical protein
VTEVSIQVWDQNGELDDNIRWDLLAGSQRTFVSAFASILSSVDRCQGPCPAQEKGSHFALDCLYGITCDQAFL